MKTIADIGLTDVTTVYDGNEGDLWELIMGQQIHIGTPARSPKAVSSRAASDGRRPRGNG
jgi:hypothetical protein